MPATTIGSPTGTRLAAGLGLVSLGLHWRRRSLQGFWVGAHATVAITGYVLLAVYLLAG